MPTYVMPRSLTLVLWELKKLHYKAFLGSSEECRQCECEDQVPGCHIRLDKGR